MRQHHPKDNIDKIPVKKERQERIETSQDEIFHCFLWLCDYFQELAPDEPRKNGHAKSELLTIVMESCSSRRRLINELCIGLELLLNINFSDSNLNGALELESRVTTLRSQVKSLQSLLLEECSIMNQLLLFASTAISTRAINDIWIRTLHNRLHSQIQRFELPVAYQIMKFFNKTLYTTIGASADIISTRLLLKQELDPILSSLRYVNRLTIIDPIFLRHVETKTSFPHPVVALYSPPPPQASIQNILLQQKEESFNTHLNDIKNPHDDIEWAETLTEAVDAFLRHDATQKDTALLHTGLLIAPHGYGKTHLCDAIEESIQKRNMDHEKVLRPKLPVDLLGSVVGESENALVSLFLCALTWRSKTSKNNNKKKNKVIVILDNLEHIIGYQMTKKINNNLDDSHAILRRQSCLFALLDMFRNGIAQQQRQSPFTHLLRNSNDVLILATSTDAIQGVKDRFDSIFYLKLPDEKERAAMINSFIISSCNCCSLPTPKEKLLSCDNDLYTQLLSKLAKRTVGKAPAAIAKIFRDAFSFSLLTCSLPIDRNFSACNPLSLMQQIDEMLQVIPPESLRSGSLDGVVSIIVESSMELLVDHGNDKNRNTTPALSLFGESAAKAWEELESLIITPLCRHDELDDLLYGGGGTEKVRKGKIICAGALLTGPPGSGLSTLAWHCASVAASVDPCMKLLIVSCTSLVHKEVGGSEQAIHKLFVTARNAAPCILVLDGLENIARVRGNDNTTYGTLDRILSVLLTEMDGISSSGDDDGRSTDARIAVIGITHNASW
eukprot:CAMPEP_0172434974 /NCGR_PEP_ID=MMETSP1064-20121228/70921_1 /TAXON_ID=202472 /ORGANISM="Aulacoseira subarctica , Strain CCAP 1002/5" /LENGTH=784 /DNA_ID=CAMNT_0013183241 /DNA_START=8 /DNA_END=2359 /DNA_ORIENTATION=-